MNYKTVNIKGKEYVTVDSRVEVFRSLYPNGGIVTDLLFDDGDRCTIKAAIFATFDEQKPIATGHASEVRNASNINKTSYIENCETSAVGRALGFLGIGLCGSIASADEVSNAVETAEKDLKIAAAKKRLNDLMKAYAEESGEDYNSLLTDLTGDKNFEQSEDFFNKKAAEYQKKLDEYSLYETEVQF